MSFFAVCLIAGVKGFDAQVADGNHNDARNCSFLQGFHSANT